VQDWRALAVSLAAAVFAAALAWFLVHRFLGEAAPLARVAAGTTILAAAYGLINLHRSLR
jgi:hypothetical protein